MNEFYSIAEENVDTKNDFQLPNLGKRTVMAVVGKPVRSDWGERRTFESQTFYRDTKPEDYDNLFASKLTDCHPPYELRETLNYHLKYYTTQAKGEKQKFLLQIKYVILPIIKKRKNNEVYVELIEDWLDGMTAKKKKPSTNIKVGDINAPAQFLIHSDSANQSMKIAYTQNDVWEILERLKLDIEALEDDLRAEFVDEIKKTLKQLEKNKDVKGRLLTIGGMIREVGIGAFANLVSSPAYELLRPFLGLGG